MKYVVIHKPDDQDFWDHVGAFDVPDDVPLDDQPQIAVEERARGNGVAVAIPWDDWVMYRVESRITVERVPRADEVETDIEPEEGGSILDDPDMAGLKRQGE